MFRKLKEKLFRNYILVAYRIFKNHFSSAINDITHEKGIENMRKCALEKDKNARHA